MNLTREIIRYENGELDFDETVTLFQALVDSGVLCHLQGSYHRMAEALHIDGYITACGKETP